MREFSILVFPYAKLRRCSSFSCGVGTFFLASSRSSCRRSVINSPLAQGFYGHGSEEEQGCGIPPFERRERWGTRPPVEVIAYARPVSALSLKLRPCRFSSPQLKAALRNQA